MKEMSKRLYLVVLLALAFFSGVEARNYPVTVAGIRVTDTNCSNISGAGITGSVSYNPATRTLTLNNATITYVNHIIECDSTMSIKLIGYNYLVTNSGLGDALYVKGDSLVIDGPEGSSLNAVVFCSGSNSRNGTNLIVRGGCTLESFGHYGITATGSYSGEFLTIDRSYIVARGATDYSIGGFTNVVLKCAAVAQPSTAVYNTTTRRMVDNGTAISDTVRIVAVYPVRIGSTYVTPQNANNVQGPNITGGTIKYIDSTKTLLLNGARISTQTDSFSGPGVLCDSNITIMVSGECVIDNSYNSYYPTTGIGLKLNGDSTSIEGGGDLIVTGGYYAISSRKLRIGPRTTVKAWGYYGSINSINFHNLYLDSCNLFLANYSPSGYVNYSYRHVRLFSNVLFNGCTIISPANCSTYTYSGGFVNATSPDTVIITNNLSTTIYPVKVNGVMVTSINAAHITGPNITGNIRYEPSTKTLYIDTATINNTVNTQGAVCCYSAIKIVINNSSIISARYPGITCTDTADIVLNNTLLRVTSNDAMVCSGIAKITLNNSTVNSLNGNPVVCHDNARILLVGKNTVGAMNNNNAITEHNAFIFHGDSSVIEGTPADSLFAYMPNFTVISTFGQLTIRGGCFVYVYDGLGIKYNSQNQRQSLIIDGSTLKVYSTHQTLYIAEFDSLVLINAEIVKPVGAYYDQIPHCMVKANGMLLYNDTLLITYVEPPVSINAAEPDGIAVAPNPASEYLSVAAAAPVHLLQLYDIQGRMLESLQPETSQARINTRALPDGVYILKIHSSNGIATKRVVIRH